MRDDPIVEEIHKIRENLLAVDPMDARTREELSNSYGAAGNLLLSTGKISEALDYLRKQLTFEETLAANDPLRLEHQTGTASAQVLGSAKALSVEGGRLQVEVAKFLQTVRTA